MKKILVGVDGSSRERAVLRAATDLARRLDARLILVRAVKLAGELPPEAWLMPEEEVTSILERRAKAAVEETAKALPPELVEGLRVDIGEPWRVICKTAEDEDVELIVIGAHGYGVLDRMLGTTAARVVNHADRSVLVVREPGTSPA